MPTAASAINSANTNNIARKKRDITRRKLIVIEVAIKRDSSADDSHSAPSSVQPTSAKPCNNVSTDACVLPSGIMIESSSCSTTGSSPPTYSTTPNHITMLTTLIKVRADGDFGNNPRIRRATARIAVSDAKIGTASLGIIPAFAPYGVRRNSHNSAPVTSGNVMPTNSACSSACLGVSSGARRRDSSIATPAPAAIAINTAPMCSMSERSITSNSSSSC